MFLLKDQGVVGLELDYCEVRAVEMSGKPSSPRITACGRLPLPPEAVKDGMVQDPQQVVSALNELWQTAGFNTREVVLGIINQNVLVRFSTFPRLPKDKLEKMIHYQSQDLFPIPLEDAVLDYSIIGENKGEHGDELDIILVAAQNEMVNDFLDVMTVGNLHFRDINVSPLSLLQFLPPSEEADSLNSLAMVDLANGYSSIVVASRQVPRFSRLLSIRLYQAAEQLGCSMAEVIELAGAAPGESFPESFSEWGETFIKELRNSIDYYLSQPDSSPVEKIILSGRGARIEGLAEQVEGFLEITTAVINPLEDVQVTDRAQTQQITAEAADYSVSISLAKAGLEG